MHQMQRQVLRMCRWTPGLDQRNTPQGTYMAAEGWRQQAMNTTDKKSEWWEGRTEVLLKKEDVDRAEEGGWWELWAAYPACWGEWQRFPLVILIRIFLATGAYYPNCSFPSNNIPLAFSKQQCQWKKSNRCMCMKAHYCKNCPKRILLRGHPFCVRLAGME